MTEERPDGGDPVGGEQATEPVEETVADAPPAGGPAAPSSGGGEQATGSDSDSGADAPPAGADLEVTVAELTNDLQRLQAEFVNYKRRVERDRELIKENATYAALTPIVDVLDAIDRAREHADTSGQGLEPGFKAIADQLERVVAGVGLTKFGAPGDAFDPTVHDALSHIGEDPEVSVTTCKVIAKSGYRIGERVVRAAQVLVVDPASN